MASATGTAVIDFGSFPGQNETSVVVSGQAAIGSGSKVEAYFMADDTTGDHTANDHRYAGLLVGLACGGIVAGSSFTIYALCTEKMQGTFQVRWVWAD